MYITVTYVENVGIEIMMLKSRTNRRRKLCQYIRTKLHHVTLKSALLEDSSHNYEWAFLKVLKFFLARGEN